MATTTAAAFNVEERNRGATSSPFMSRKSFLPQSRKSLAKVDSKEFFLKTTTTKLGWWEASFTIFEFSNSAHLESSTLLCSYSPRGALRDVVGRSVGRLVFESLE